jgi:hypothetical protein
MCISLMIRITIYGIDISDYIVRPEISEHLKKYKKSITITGFYLLFKSLILYVQLIISKDHTQSKEL